MRRTFLFMLCCWLADTEFKTAKQLDFPFFVPRRTTPTTPVPTTTVSMKPLIVPAGNLTCFACKLDFRSQPYNSTHHCLGVYGSEVSKSYLVNCGPNSLYCKVERTEVNGILLYLTRECSDVCYYGCRPKGFGINFELCTECCDTHGCNSMYPESNASMFQLSVEISIAYIFIVFWI